jgi:hypothetical protein
LIGARLGHGLLSGFFGAARGDLSLHAAGTKMALMFEVYVPPFFAQRAAKRGPSRWRRLFARYSPKTAATHARRHCAIKLHYRA